MTRRPARKPDTRPKWSDPDLPCVRSYRMRDGTIVTEVDPDYEHRYREHLFHTSPHPDLRSDPTYNLRRRPK